MKGKRGKGKRGKQPKKTQKKQTLILVEAIPFGMSQGEKKVCKNKRDVEKYKKHFDGQRYTFVEHTL